LFSDALECAGDDVRLFVAERVSRKEERLRYCAYGLTWQLCLYLTSGLCALPEVCRART